MKNAFCTLYDRCLYGCSIDLLYSRSFIFYQTRLVVMFSSEPNVSKPSLRQVPNLFAWLKLEFIFQLIY